MPKISILLCAYNGERHLQEAIQSLLNQTYPDFELIIVNDGSTDRTSTILNDLSLKDVRVRVLTNATNIGLTRSLNTAFEHARGSYIARMDADDVAHSERLARQILFLESHPDIDVVGTAYEWIDEQGRVIGAPNVLTQSNEIHRALPRKNPLLHSSVMMRTQTLESAHGYDETYSKAQDYDLWLRLSSKTKFANLKDILMQKRLRKKMLSFTHEHEQLRCAARARTQAIHRGDYPLSCAIYILKPLVASLLPLWLVRWLRVYMFGQKQYDHPSLK